MGEPVEAREGRRFRGAKALTPTLRPSHMRPTAEGAFIAAHAGDLIRGGHVLSTAGSGASSLPAQNLQGFF
jgi:hypothetical protein